MSELNVKLFQLDVNCIFEHPDNPRKDIGDITELTESIKKNGVMQNLTVIPGHYEDGELIDIGYTLIIGHRRFAAAKAAGYKTVPCRIVKDMDKKNQVSTMLEENMQRNDLTVFEQAQGFQMMLDLGETEATISEKTGFSKKTVKHRLNLAKLNAKTLKEKTDDNGEFQLSLKDLYELEAIEDIKTRNKILAEARDSRDLVWKAKQAVVNERKNKNLQILMKLVEDAGIPKAPDKAEQQKFHNDKWDILWEINLQNDPPEQLKTFKRKDIMWVSYWGNSFAIIAPAKPKEKKLSDWEIQRQQLDKNKKEIARFTKGINASIKTFVKELTAGNIEPIKEDLELYKKLVNLMYLMNASYITSNLSQFFCGKGLYELQHSDEDKYNEFLSWADKLTPIERILVHLSGYKYELATWDGKYAKDAASKMNALIDFLGMYGFSVSDEEKQILDGTHELYAKGE